LSRDVAGQAPADLARGDFVPLLLPLAG